MGKQPAIMFYVGDYLKDTRHLSLEAKGAWMDLLLFMFHAEPRGRITLPIDGFSRLLGAGPEQTFRVLSELVSTHVCDCLINGDQGDMSPFCPPNVPACPLNVTIINRRMAREEKQRDYNRLKKQKQRSSKECPENVKVPLSYSSSSSSSIKEIIPEETAEEPASSGDSPDHFVLTSEESCPEVKTVDEPTTQLTGFDCPDGFERIENEGLLRWITEACAKLVVGPPLAKSKFPECYALVNKLISKGCKTEAVERALHHLVVLEVRQPWPYAMRVASGESRKLREAEHTHQDQTFKNEIKKMTKEANGGQEKTAG